MDPAVITELREQRLTLRVLAQYRSLCRAGALPRRAQIDPRLFGHDWHNCLLIDIDPQLECSRFAYVGDGLRDPSWPTLERQSLADCDEGTLLALATSGLTRVLAKGVPLSGGGVGIHHGIPIVYRCILLPLAESAGRIDGVIGAASYREIPVVEEIHALREQPAGQNRSAG
jgi:hypothetical protein